MRDWLKKKIVLSSCGTGNSRRGPSRGVGTEGKRRKKGGEQGLAEKNQQPKELETANPMLSILQNASGVRFGKGSIMGGAGDPEQKGKSRKKEKKGNRRRGHPIGECRSEIKHKN